MVRGRDSRRKKCYFINKYNIRLCRALLVLAIQGRLHLFSIFLQVTMLKVLSTLCVCVCLPVYERTARIYFFRELFHPTLSRARSRHSVGHSQWSPTGSSTTCSSTYSPLRSRTTQEVLDGICGGFGGSPRRGSSTSGHRYNHGVLFSLPLCVSPSFLPPPPSPLAHPYRRSRSREAPYDTPVIISRLSGGSR